MHDKVMKLALSICHEATVDEIIELCGYLQVFVNARMNDRPVGMCAELHEELI